MGDPAKTAGEWRVMTWLLQAAHEQGRPHQLPYRRRSKIRAASPGGDTEGQGPVSQQMVSYLSITSSKKVAFTCFVNGGFDTHTRALLAMKKIHRKPRAIGFGSN